MVFGLSSCTIKLSTTSVPAGTPEHVPVNTTNDYVPYVPTSGFTLEDRMEEKTTIELVKADIGDDTYIAPAQDKTTHQWGYIDLSGKWVIQPKYKTASDFSGNIACVSDVYGTYFFIDRLGSVLFDEAAGTVVTAESSFSEGLANVSTAVEFTQKMTYIDTTGKMPVNLGKLPLAKGVTYKTSRYVELATPFRNGYALAMRTTNSTLEASGVNSLESAYIINEEGSVCSALPQGIDISEYGFDENMRVVIKAENGLLGLADSEGEIIVNPSYLRILHCEGDLYLVCNQSGFWGFLDKDGKVVIDFKYNKALPFSEGLAAVSNGEKWAFIDESDELVTPFIYDDVKALRSTSSGSEENYGAFSSGIALVNAGRYWGAIDSTGDILFAAESEECPVTCISNGYISFEYSGGCGVFTTDGKLVLLPEFESIGEFR